MAMRPLRLALLSALLSALLLSALLAHVDAATRRDALAARLARRLDLRVRGGDEEADGDGIAADEASPPEMDDVAFALMEVKDEASAAALVARFAAKQLLPAAFACPAADTPLSSEQVGDLRFLVLALSHFIQKAAIQGDVPGFSTIKDVPADGKISTVECAALVALARPQHRFMMAAAAAAAVGGAAAAAAGAAVPAVPAAAPAAAAVAAAAAAPAAAPAAAAAAPPPLVVKMWTASTPCQSTKAMMGWFISQAGFSLNVQHAYLGTGAGLNGIQNWRAAAVAGFAGILAGVQALAGAAVAPAAAVPAAAGVAAGNFAQRMEALRVAYPAQFNTYANNHLQACIVYLQALPAGNTQGHDAAAGFVAPAAAAGAAAGAAAPAHHPGCAVACAMAMHTTDEIKSCTIAIAQRGGGGIYPAITLSGSVAARPSFLAGGAIAAPGAGVVAAVDFGKPKDRPRAIAHPAFAPAVAAGGAGAGAAAVPAARIGFRQHWVATAAGAGGAVAAADANQWPAFEGTCSEDKLLRRFAGAYNAVPTRLA